MNDETYKNAIDIYFDFDLENNIRMRNETIKCIKAIKDRMASKSVLLCSHNTILALKYKGEVTQVVTMDGERNIIRISQLNEHLAVPGYEPKVAKEWMKEKLEMCSVSKNLAIELEELNKLYSKTTLSEQELREIVLEDKKFKLEFQNKKIDLFLQLAGMISNILTEKLINKKSITEKEQEFINNNGFLF